MLHVPYFRNTSSHDSAKVRELIAFATQAIDLSDVAVSVKGTRHAYGGMAYLGVPNISPAKQTDAQFLVTLRIGKADKFPTDTARDVIRWKQISKEEWDAEYARGNKLLSGRWTRAKGNIYEIGTKTREGYGGKKSPIIELRNWQEGLVYLTAHEGCHIHQFKNKLKRSEVACEQFAACIVEQYRTAR